MSTKSASRSVAPQSAKNLYADKASRDSTFNRTHGKPIIDDRKGMAGKPSDKSGRKNSMYTSWGPDNRHLKTTDGGTMSVNEARLRSFLLDTRGLSPKNVDTIMRSIVTLKRVYGITEPTTENALMLKALCEARAGQLTL